MSIPLLTYPLSTQNQRVNGFEASPGDEQPKIYSTNDLPTAAEMDEIIWASYRQIFSEHQILNNNREIFLESQLRFNQIKVKDFIKGLLLSKNFHELNYYTNNNYRFVELCIQRVLGRDVYNQKEKMAFAIIIGSQGLEVFTDMLLNSNEYFDNFNDSTVPYQRRRMIAQRSKGEKPFNLKTPRCDQNIHKLTDLPNLTKTRSTSQFKPQEQIPKAGDPALFINMLS
uniref:Phycobilisome rod-core linker protein n=1 Tax=Hildenbrandia rivularis TaxID=135206 RepID=A0A1C9CFI4_9FLOR|nr:phycobilisome rod-core linker protein [Hildenbrandia rivularis]AOM67143.1 phycobilisome rod-core linker protein [Hildenbrandia rivularis]